MCFWTFQTESISLRYGGHAREQQLGSEQQFDCPFGRTRNWPGHPGNVFRQTQLMYNKLFNFFFLFAFIFNTNSILRSNCALFRVKLILIFYYTESWKCMFPVAKIHPSSLGQSIPFYTTQPRWLFSLPTPPPPLCCHCICST